MPWTAAIIAGGAASRLGGRDKTSLRVGDRSILERQLAVIRPLTNRVLLVGTHPERPEPDGVRVLDDLVPDAGALGGIYTALASADTDRVVAVACDLPFLTSRFLAALAAAGQDAELVIPRSRDGYQPLCACYSAGCLSVLERHIALGARRVQDLVGDVRTREIGPGELTEYDPDGTLFFNVNTPDDYRRAQGLATRTAPSAL